MNKPQSAPMYESAKKIYPREIGGRFDKLSKLATVTLLGLFYILPWINWDERQAVLFDMPARKFYILGLTLWPQDFPFLALLGKLLPLQTATVSDPPPPPIINVFETNKSEPHGLFSPWSDAGKEQ